MNENERLGLEKLQEAFRAVNAEEWENTEKVPEEEIFYSDQYEKNMEDLIHKQKYPYLRYVNTVGKRAAVIALAILMTFGASMSIAAVRTPVVNFFMKVHDSFLELFFAPEDIEKAPERIETIYTLGCLPERSEWLTQFVNEKDVTTTWANDEVNLTLIQTTLDARLFVNDEVAEIHMKEIGEGTVAVIEKFGVTVYLWNTEEYAFHLVVKGYLTAEETARIMGSLAVGGVWEDRGGKP